MKKDQAQEASDPGEEGNEGTGSGKDQMEGTEEEVKRSNRRSNQRRHTHNSRTKLNMKFEELSRFMAPNLGQSSSSSSGKAHKSKIISDALNMYTSLVKKKEMLETDITFSTSARQAEWIEKTVENNPNQIVAVLVSVGRILSIKQDWAVTEVWMPHNFNGGIRLRSVQHVVNPTTDADRLEVLESFCVNSAALEYEPLQGPQGRAFQTMRSEWILQLEDVTAFPSGAIVAEVDLRTACSVPVLSQTPGVGSECLAVMMFYASKARAFDPVALSLIGTTCTPQDRKHRQKSSDELVVTHSKLVNAEDLIKRVIARFEGGVAAFEPGVDPPLG